MLNNENSRLGAIYALGMLFLLCSAVAGLVLGSTELSLVEVFDSIKNKNTASAAYRIFTYVRIPRVAASLLCGAALSVSGAVIQTVLANRLASPSIIGVNSGAGLAVSLCTALGIYGGWRVSLAAFVGAFLTVMLVSLTARRFGTRSGTLILIGVAVNALLGALSDSIVTFVPDVAIMTNDFRIGDFSSATLTKLGGAVIPVLISIAVLMLISRQLDVLTLGDEGATGLGMNVSLVRVVFLLLCAILAGCAVSIAGLVSFVGLMVPHALRRVLRGGCHVHLILLCAVWGGGFVCLCDTLARVIFAPYEISVGIITAFLGAPFFIFILLKGKGERNHA